MDNSMFLKDELTNLCQLLNRTKLFNIISKIAAMIMILFSSIILYRFRFNICLPDVKILMMLVFIFNTILLISYEMEKECIKKTVCHSVFLIKEMLRTHTIIKNFIPEKQKNTIIKFIKNKKSVYEKLTENQITLLELDRFLTLQENN